MMITTSRYSRRTAMTAKPFRGTRSFGFAAAGTATA